MRAVFLDQQTFSPTLDFSPLEQRLTQTTYYPTTTASQIIPRCLGHEVIITNKVILDEHTLSALPELKLICVAATGTNNVDLSAARALGITVTNAANYAGASVAQYIFSQLLHYVQQIDQHNALVKQGAWQKSETFCVLGQPVHELAGKTLGIIGLGHIAEKVIAIAKAFEMNVLISERKGASEIRENRVSFEYLLAHSDIVSLHCPLTEATASMINTDTLALMKRSAVLVNTARGGIIDSIALKHALTTHKLAYAILDVLEHEPPSPKHPLLQEEITNLNITAHMAWSSQQAQQRLINIMADNIAAFTQGAPQNQVS